VLAVVMVLLLCRAAYLHVVDRDFLQGQGDARYLRTVEVLANRGMIVDRSGEPLAISSPVDSVWINPKELSAGQPQWSALEKMLGVNVAKALTGRMGREFVYLRRHIDPSLGQQVMALGLPGIHLQREYKRFYPAGEVVAHLVGFTNVDDRGQEGMELVYNDWLSSESGAKQVIRDRLGRVVEDVGSVRLASPGKQLTLTIDKRIQYLAYRELKAAIQRHQARAGSAVVMDARSGEVLALVNQPSFNPNNRSELRGDLYRNRAVTDLIEPGSTMKPFTVAAALESGAFTDSAVINTAPGYMRIKGGSTVKDFRNYGVVDLTTLIQKSSNVGAAKLALGTEPEVLWSVLAGVGLGMPPGTNLPGESGGLLPHYSMWNEAQRVTLSYGYGMSVTPLQLAQAYTALANDGRMVAARFVRSEGPSAPMAAERVFSPQVARKVREMMEMVVQPGGTGQQGAISGYRVAAKTGTVKKIVGGSYSDDRYVSLFAGLAPASDPRLVMVVVVDEPGGEEYYGGAVAAPVFSQVMAGALRLLDVAPDAIPAVRTTVVMAGGH